MKDDHLTKKLVVAAEEGDFNTVVDALNEGASPDAMGPNSGALHVAAFGGHDAVVGLLLQRGANPNTADNQSYFPLQLAASKGHVAVMKQLIDAGANLEATTKHGGTALHVAAASGFADAVELLVKAGANIEALDHGDNTVLATALSLAKADVAEILMRHQAKLDVINGTGETLLILLARSLKKLQVRKFGQAGRYLGESGRFIIHHGQVTFDAGQATVIPWEAQAELDLDPSIAARQLQYIAACNLFISLANAAILVHHVDRDGHSAFNLACHLGEPSLIRALHAQGAGITYMHTKHFTGLHFAAGSGRLDGLQCLLELVTDLDIDRTDDFGWTPLHYLADIGGEPAMAHLLLSKGANPAIASTQARGDFAVGVTPRDVALHWKDQEMADLLTVA